MVAKVAARMQALFGTVVNDVAEVHRVVLRRRKFSPASLAQTFVLGFLRDPKPSDEELAQMAALFGVQVTTQAIGQRFTQRLVDFLQALFQRATEQVVAAQVALAPLLKRFPAVYLLDSTTVTLPDSLSNQFPGCGGSHGGGQAAMKLQVRWDLRSGGLDAVSTESGRTCDYKTPLQQDRLPPGSLRITDLGYFDTAVLQEMDRQGAFWITRLQFGISVFTPAGQPLRLLEWLAKQRGPFIDQSVLVGTERKVACRIVAWRLPKEQANRRRQKLITETRRKDGRTPTKERLAWCDWTILITNVPADLLAPKEVAILYRARWQVELLFKRWKSLGLIAELGGAAVVRQMVRLWSRLLAVIVQHWLLLSCAWGDPRTSLAKACEAIREHAKLLAVAVRDRVQLKAEIMRLKDVLQVTAKQNKRKQPSTFELLNDPALLGYALT